MTPGAETPPRLQQDVPLCSVSGENTHPLFHTAEEANILMATLLAPYVADGAAAGAQNDVTRLVLTLPKSGEVTAVSSRLGLLLFSLN